MDDGQIDLDTLNFIQDIALSECNERIQTWLLSVVAVIYFTLLFILIITGTTVGLLAKREAKRIENEYEPSMEDDFDPLDDEEREDLADVYESVPEEYLNKGREGYETVSTIQDLRDNSLDHISEEESEYSGSIHSSEKDSTTDITEDATVQKDDDTTIQMDEDTTIKIDEDTTIQKADDTTVKIDYNTAKKIDEDTTIENDEDNISEITTDSIPYMDDSTEVSDSETSIKTVIEVQSSKLRTSSGGELPQDNNKSNSDENLPLPVQNEDRRGSRGRSVAPLHVRRKGQSVMDNQFRLNMKKVRKTSQSTLDSYSTNSSRSSIQSSLAPGEQASDLIPSVPKMQRSNSANKAAFVLRLLSRPEEYEEGISEFKSKPKEPRSPTGRKISEVYFNKNRLSVPDVVVPGRSFSNSNSRTYNTKDTMRSRSPLRGQIDRRCSDRDQIDRSDNIKRNRSLDGLTVLTGTLSKRLGRFASAGLHSADQRDSIA